MTAVYKYTHDNQRVVAEVKKDASGVGCQVSLFLIYPNGRERIATLYGVAWPGIYHRIRNFVKFYFRVL